MVCSVKRKPLYQIDTPSHDRREGRWWWWWWVVVWKWKRRCKQKKEDVQKWSDWFDAGRQNLERGYVESLGIQAKCGVKNSTFAFFLFCFLSTIRKYAILQIYTSHFICLRVYSTQRTKIRTFLYKTIYDQLDIQRVSQNIYIYIYIYIYIISLYNNFIGWGLLMV